MGVQGQEIADAHQHLCHTRRHFPLLSHSTFPISALTVDRSYINQASWAQQQEAV